MNAALPTRWVLALPFGLALSAAMPACGSSSNSASSGGDAGSRDSGALDSGAGSDSALGQDTGGGQDTGAPMDAPADVDNGAPSTNYPAPHPPLPVLTNADHGPVLASPKVILVFYPGYPYEAALQTFAQKLGASTYWPAVTGEYGVGAIAYASTIELTGQTAPGNISSTAIQSWVSSEIESGAFGTPDPDAIYTIVYPQSTVITQPNPVSPVLGTVQSCSAFGGYHDNAAVTPEGGAAQNYAYAVIPTCSTVVNDLTAVMSHEWVEASTDPQPTASGPFTLTGGPHSAFFNVDANHVIWAVASSGGEAGDLCQPEGNPIYITPPDIGSTVQRTWSNLSAAASHDPCVPAPTGLAFFDSAPVLTEMVTFTSSLTGTIKTQGVTIPVGQSKTIEVDLFSDGDTGGPWTVQADDVLYKDYGNYGVPNSLAFKWDRTQGVNGEKLHLTIAVMSAAIIGNGHAFMITSTKGSRVAVWPGMIVE